jgi:hypothetical protein
MSALERIVAVVSVGDLNAIQGRGDSAEQGVH